MINKNSKLKIAVGVSGGVDSSVCLHLLHKQGYDVTGVYIQCWDEKADGCRAEEDRKDAVMVCATVGVPFKSLNLIKEYKNKVIDVFYKEIQKGRTPNPDIICNKEIKFGLFLEWALQNGFDYVATGHYAQILQNNNLYHLLMGEDESKDQSYFLYRLNQKMLSKSMFPLGTYSKKQIRQIAKDANLHTHSKPDSVGICFIGEVDMKEFIQKQIPIKKGNVLNLQGEILGSHDGVWFYTIGQRHGFTIDKYVGVPLYVVQKNVQKNELIVGTVSEANSQTFLVENLNWISDQLPKKFPLQCKVRIRHLGELFTCTVTTSKVDGELLVKLQDPEFGIAPGQSAVFYINNELLGGGDIKSLISL